MRIACLSHFTACPLQPELGTPFLTKKGCATVGFGKSIWTVTIDVSRILVGAHIYNFVIACTNRLVRARLLDAFEGTYEGALQRYL